MSDTQQRLDKLAEHIANLEAEVALLNNVVSVQPALRDQFAMAALGGLLASPHTGGEPYHLAEWAYEYADEMLKERER